MNAHSHNGKSLNSAKVRAERLQEAEAPTGSQEWDAAPMMPDSDIALNNHVGVVAGGETM